MYTTELSLHPAVVRWLDANYSKTENAYDLRSDALYIVFQTALFRKNIKYPIKKFKKTEKFVPIRIAINEWEFYRFGWNIPNFAQIRISRMLFDMMMKNFCNHIAYAYAYGGISRDVTIRRILVENLFDDEEINYYYIRKYYQRKFQNTGKEQEIIDFVNYTLANIAQV
jgi:hypothetical protein